MEHLTDKQLLELLEQFRDKPLHLPDHLSQCEACRLRWQDLQGPWEALGEWTLDDVMPNTDLTERILGQINATPTIDLWQSQALIRIAASVIIGIGVGALLGRVGSAPVSVEQASEAIYLDALALNSSTGWTDPLLGDSQEP